MTGVQTCALPIYGKALEVVEQSGEDVTVKSEPKPIKVKRCDLKSMLREGDEVSCLWCTPYT